MPRTTTRGGGCTPNQRQHNVGDSAAITRDAGYNEPSCSSTREEQQGLLGTRHQQTAKEANNKRPDSSNKVDGHLVGSALAHNRRVLVLARDYAAIIAGLCAGVLGVQGLWGFAVFVAVNILHGILMMLGGVHQYFPTRKELLASKFFHGLLSFILFWTLSYDVVYVF